MSPEKLYNGIPENDLKRFLDEKYIQYNTLSFIKPDPISIPHNYSSLQDIEISGFLTATIAWGRRDLILRSSQRLMILMGNKPYEFIMNSSEFSLEYLNGFVHRTFNSVDCYNFLSGLRFIYNRYNSLEDVLVEGIQNGGSVKDGLSHLRSIFFSAPHNKRSEKHFADVNSGAAGKRLNMFLRWMVRKDDRGVDFGLWKRIDSSALFIPIDLHSGNTARKLGLLTRQQNDWKAVEELTNELRQFDPADPVKYDFALFGLGVNEK